MAECNHLAREMAQPTRWGLSPGRLPRLEICVRLPRHVLRQYRHRHLGRSPGTERLGVTQSVHQFQPSSTIIGRL